MPLRRHRRKRVLVGALIAVVVLPAGALVGFLIHTYAAMQARESWIRSSLDEFHDTFMADQAALAALDFNRQEEGGDAGPFLNPRLNWTGSKEAKAYRPEDVGPPHLRFEGQTLRTQLGDEWWNEPLPEDAQELDFSWMEQLHSFGYWDLDTASPRAGADRLEDLWFVHPDLTALQLWARLRLLKGREEGAIEPAFRDVHALARLFLTSESIHGEMAGFLLLRMMAHVASAWQVAGEAGVPLLSESQERQFMRARLAASAYLEMGVPIQYQNAHEDIVVARCSSLAGALEHAIALRPLLEHSRAEDYLRLSSILESTNCRLRSHRRVWAAGTQHLHPPETIGFWQRLRWYVLPRALAGTALGRWYGESVLASFVPALFGMYRDDRALPEHGTARPRVFDAPQAPKR